MEELLPSEDKYQNARLMKQRYENDYYFNLCAGMKCENCLLYNDIHACTQMNRKDKYNRTCNLLTNIYSED